MGSFPGHLMSASFALLYGLWWLFQSFWLHLMKKGMRSTHYSMDSLQCKSHIPLFCCPRLPLEPLLKIALPLVGVFEEALLDIDERDGTLLFAPYSIYNETLRVGDTVPFNAHLAKFDHMTVFAMYTLSGIIDLLALCIHYPKHTPQIFLTLAFFVTSFMMYFHGNDDLRPLENVVHHLLFYCVSTTAVFSGLRLLSATNLLINTGFSLSKEPG